MVVIQERKHSRKRRTVCCIEQKNWNGSVYGILFLGIDILYVTIHSLMS